MLKEKILFIFSRFHADPSNIHHKCGTGIAQMEILDVLKKMGYDVYFGGQEDPSYPEEYITESKAIIYIAPALPKILKKKTTGKLILFANNSHVRVRNERMYASAKRWNLPVESLSPESYFLQAYEKSDFIFVAANAKGVQTFLDNGVSLQKIARWKNCVYPDIYRPAEQKFSRFTFIHWSSEIGLRKGLPALLAAWKKWDNPHADLILMGIMKKVGKKLLYRRNWYGKLVSNHPTNVRVFASKHGFPSQDPFVIQTLAKSHVGIFPTLEDNQPAACMEMASCGLPLILTEEAGFELNDSWSYQVNPDDVESILEALEKAYRDPQREQKGANARAFMIKYHDWREFRENFAGFMKTL